MNHTYRFREALHIDNSRVMRLVIGSFMAVIGISFLLLFGEKVFSTEHVHGKVSGNPTYSQKVLVVVIGRGGPSRSIALIA